MTYQNPQMARGARQLKAVAAVVALIAVTLAGLILALAPHEARPESLLVCAGMLGIAIFMWAYAARPGLFTGDEGVFEDPLRTTYTVPARDLTVQSSQSTDAHHRAVPVSQHIYAWQDVRRVEAGERVWTREYTRMVARQTGLVIGGLLTFAFAVVGVTLGLGESVGATWFLAAAIILPVGFAMSHRSGIVDSMAYPTEQMAALPDLAWTPTVAMAPEATEATGAAPTAPVPVAAHAA